MTLRLAVDIGGTFTDLVLIDDGTGSTRIAKVLTTPDNPAEGVEHGLEQILREAGSSAADVAQVIHATTLVTNALIERTGTRTGLLTTRGFRDSIQIARESRYDIYDLFLELPRPLVPRRWRREVDERMLNDGSELLALDEEQAAAEVALLRDAGVQAIAICLLHSYRDDAHERRLGEIVASVAPGMVVSLSSEVVPTLREYERAVTTVANVYVRPLVDRYLADLDRRLSDAGFGGSLFIVLSAGNLATPETARLLPIRAVESGPAAGALATATYGKLADRRHLLSFDMGGTTAKACLIEDSEPLIASQLEVARVHRFKKGSGFPLEVASIDMMEIGAGGGSIARVDQFGLLKVGPDSAGADPGPACYGQGGRLPTVTDADLLLGYLDADFFLGGTMALDLGAAREALSVHVAQPLQMELAEAAWGIHQVVNENMATAARIHAVERGIDLSDYALLAFGGAGPLHASRVARLLGIGTVLAPLGAGATSALGCLWAPLAFDFVRSQYFRLEEIVWDRLNGLFAEMEREGRALLESGGVAPSDVTVRRSGDLRYVGQGYEIRVPLPEGRLGPHSLAPLVEAFEAEYRRLYHRACPDIPVEALHWRLVASGPAPRPTLEQARSGDGVGRKAGRRAYFPELHGYYETPVYDRYRLPLGAQLDGPAIVEERESTVIVPPEARATVDRQGSLVITLTE